MNIGHDPAKTHAVPISNGRPPTGDPGVSMGNVSAEMISASDGYYTQVRAAKSLRINTVHPPNCYESPIYWQIFDLVKKQKIGGCTVFKIKEILNFKNFEKGSLNSFLKLIKAPHSDDAVLGLLEPRWVDIQSTSTVSSVSPTNNAALGWVSFTANTPG